MSCMLSSASSKEAPKVDTRITRCNACSRRPCQDREALSHSWLAVVRTSVSSQRLTTRVNAGEDSLLTRGRGATLGALLVQANALHTSLELKPRLMRECSQCTRLAVYHSAARDELNQTMMTTRRSTTLRPRSLSSDGIRDASHQRNTNDFRRQLDVEVKASTTPTRNGSPRMHGCSLQGVPRSSPLRPGSGDESSY